MRLSWAAHAPRLQVSPFYNKAQAHELGVALQDFQALENVWKDGFWREVNLQNGPEVRQLREADQWLNEKDNQKDDLWDLWARVLDVQCQVFVAAVKAVPLALQALDKQTGALMPPSQKQNVAGLLKVGIRTMAGNQLTFLEGITSVVQKRGIYWLCGIGGFNNQFFISAKPI